MSDLSLDTDYAEEPDSIDIMADRPVTGKLTLQLLDPEGAKNGEPLLDNPYDELRFYFNGELISLNFGAVSGTGATYEDLLAAIQAALATSPAADKLTAALGQEFTITAEDGQQAHGQEIEISTKYGFLYTMDSDCGWFSSEEVSTDSGLVADISADWAITGDVLVQRYGERLNGTPENDFITMQSDGGIYAKAGDDLMVATAAAMYVRGEEGNDVILAGNQSFAIYGGTGDDIIIAGDSCHDIYGGEGDDLIRLGASANFFIIGGDGNDVITCGDSAGDIQGGLGDDIIKAANNCRSLHGNEGNDVIITGDSAINIYGDDGNDKIRAGNDASNIYGGDGDDIIIAGDRSHIISGADGADYIEVGEDARSVFGDDGNDTIVAGNNADSIGGGLGDDEITAGDGAHNIQAGGGDDIIRVGDNAERIYGDNGSFEEGASSGGNDQITVGADSKYIMGGMGKDLIIVGSDSSYIYGDRDDLLGGDDDHIILGDRVRDVDGAGGNDTIEGGDECNNIYSGYGDDVITLGNNASAIQGGYGDDIITVGDYAESIGAYSGNNKIVAGASATGILVGVGNDAIIVGSNASYIECDALFQLDGENPSLSDGGNDILISNYIDEIGNAQGGAGNDIIIGNVNTPSLELLALQNITSFEILLRAITDDVLPLDFTTHERLESYGITINSETDAKAVTLSDLWSLSAEKTTPTTDVFTSFQSGITLELEILNKKEWDFETTITASEKEIGKPQEITLAQEGYYISKVLGQGQYGHVEELDGKWVYILDGPMDSGPVQGPNAVANADTVTVEITNQSGETWEYAIPVTIVDDAPEIEISENQTKAVFYQGADWTKTFLYLYTNGEPGTIISKGESSYMLPGDYGDLEYTLTRYPESGNAWVASMQYVPHADLTTNGTDVFTFKVVDGDGDEAEASVAFDSDMPEPGSPITGIDQLTFDEENLPDGARPDQVSLVKNGQLTYDLPSGLSGLEIRYNGQSMTVQESAYENLITDNGIFSAWLNQDAVSFSFILSDALGLTGEVGTLQFEAVLTDGAGNVYDGNMININLINDSLLATEIQAWGQDALA